MATVPSFQELHTTLTNGVYVITFNRPTKKNAFSLLLMQETVVAMKFAKSSEAVKVVLFTGSGDFFSSGNDLTNFTQMAPNEEGVKEAKNRLYHFVDEFITFPKPLIAAVNGHAIGIGCTMLAHFDYLYAYEKAGFKTPFTDLGQTPEACSSALFPQLFGKLRANEILVLGKQFSATELKGSYVTEVFSTPKAAVDKALSVAQYLADAPTQCIRSSKRLVSQNHIQFLQKVNREEVEELGKRWQSEECMAAISKFLTRRAPTAKL